jgi:tetratricopeptide (TPR) repeat protein
MNAHEATACARCNFPLHPAASPAAPPPPEPAKPEPAAAPRPETEARPFDPNIRRVRPIRPRPPRGPQQQLQTQLWVILGGLTVVIILFTAFNGFKQSNPPAPVAGAQQEQQHIADMARAELAKDSTNVNARIALANVLYDTGNWSEAIVHYRAAMRTDPDRIETIVDLGVCYYNLSNAEEAIRLFNRALELEPKHPIALFNLGIVHEGQQRFADALKFYERARQANPPEGMAQALDAAMERVKGKI